MKRKITFLLLTVFLTVGFSQGQSKYELTKNQINNLCAAICSENPGLKKSAMYLAGLYRIEEASEKIKDQLYSSKDPSIQILAALTLYEICNNNSLCDLEKVANDINQDKRVRQMVKAIHDQWLSNNYEYTSVKN